MSIYLKVLVNFLDFKNADVADIAGVTDGVL
jgi:hypothetical protein